MPGIEAAAAAAERNDDQLANEETASFNTLSSRNGFWSKQREDFSNNQLQKFWSELSPQARQELLRIDKQTLFEQARKNTYCSRCNGLLLEGFLQIVMYGKSLQQEGPVTHHPFNRLGALKNQNDGCEDDIQDPFVHPWGGLTTTREGTLTLLDCYLYSKSLKGLQNVFDSSRSRERERELLYPDACGGGGRGWISQRMGGYGRGLGTRETCALHTAGLSVDTLVDFWSALGEETRLSLLRMKEEDFIERLMYRFDSKRFCRDCRRNVIREFKELKELKRMRREPRCTSWFCVADTAFQYEVSHDTVQADWHQIFVDTFGTYHHFEWAVGTGEGKFDILEFENVGLSGRVQVKGLDLSGLSLCYITLRAWKMDGRCTELSVKAHALKGQQCVHCRLVVGDGFVSITKGESIKTFFEHAEEAEEEEDDDSMDKDGNELDGECSRPQKHAKSPELAREFLLDAATVIFKEQVEKAFREGTARQNAHSIFVCLALKLLEDRVHVACKEIITLEKQMKLLEEEEKEKREEEERKERRRTKEREKKLRRKERLREKEKDREKKCSEPNEHSLVLEFSEQELKTVADEESNVICNGEFISKTGEAIPSRSVSPDIQDEPLLDKFIHSDLQNHSGSTDGEFASTNDGMSPFPIDHLKYSRRKLKFGKEFQQDVYSKWYERRRYSENGTVVGKYEPRHHGDNFDSVRSLNGSIKQLKNISVKSNVRNVGPKYGEKFPCSSNRIHDRYNSHACSCNQYNEYRSKVEPHMSRVVRDNKSVFKSESVSDMSKPYYRLIQNQVEYLPENFGRPKNKTINVRNAYYRDSITTKKVWEPMESQKNYPRSNSDSDVTLRCSTFKGETVESDQFPESSVSSGSDEVTRIPFQINHEDKDLHEEINSEPETEGNSQNGSLHLKEKSQQYKEATDEEGELCPFPRSLHGTLDLYMSSSSNSDHLSSCLSEGDSNISSSNPQNTESSPSSDSEDASQNLEGRETSVCLQNGFNVCQEAGMAKGDTADGGEHIKSQVINDAGTNTWGTLPSKIAPYNENGRVNMSISAQPRVVFPQLHNQSIQFPIFQSSAMGYYNQSPLSWPAAPTNGFLPFPHPNHCVFASPFRYALDGNTHFMQYGALQHPTPQMLNCNHVPVIQSVAQSNGNIGKDHVKVSNLGGLKEAHPGANVKRVFIAGLQPMETSATAGNGKNLKTGKSDVGNTGFSLFHFGGPVDVPPGLKSEPASLKEEIGRELSSKLSDHSEDDQNCNKKDSIEEYNLFAASNGIKFSFF
ncbi:hypothetical protein ACH5RR_002584 [Cinchona calisaya]|uniref:Stress response protein NST1 n=1 Tax=Cinchona calisaya TaxID=153742 RepID=A0ABD3ASQ7_9GENT